jgi:hypothetical protein
MKGYLIMKYLARTQQGLDTESSISAIAEDLGTPENTIRAVEISFYDHEIYAGNELIASISHDTDDFVTQRWVVSANRWL